MARKASLSGFPELLPAERIVEVRFMNILRQVFELHGFCEIETRAVEPLAEILRKGEIDKELYLVGRNPHRDSDQGLKAEFALHFDLTVPFARFVRENAGHLDFPFRRYQIQKVWRGERPQDGRMREFTQADIDIVTDTELAVRHEAELLGAIVDALRALPIPAFTIRANNRKLAQGFFEAVAPEHTAAVFLAVDKLERIGHDKALRMLLDAGLDDGAARACLRFASLKASSVEELSTLIDALCREHGVDFASSALGQEGLAELAELLSLADAPEVVADLAIVRGLDYYTGSVFETSLEGHEDLGSICSGGRYDSLVNVGRKSYPGVGISIGLSRLLSRVLGGDLVRATRPSPACVLVALADDGDWAGANATARTLRARGIAAEVAPEAAKFGRQIKHADKRGIPFVWFMDPAGHTVKDIRSGEQVEADPATWTPPAEDLAPRLIE